MNYTFYGVDVVSLAEKYGTPLYVMSEDKIIEEIREFKKAFDDKYKNASTSYASKAFLTRDMIRILKNENIGIDVVSGGELYGAILENFPAEKIMFHGNAKTDAEIEMGINYKVGRFVCDSIDEIKSISKIACDNNAETKILIRVTPGVDSHTHKYIATASADSKFGIPLGKMREAVALSMNLPNIELTGFHFHVGSQLSENTSHIMATEIILNMIKELYSELKFVTKDFDLGGGFGIRYTKDDDVKPVSYFLDPMVKLVEDFCKENNLEIPHLHIEPGRRIVGEAGITLYTVQNVEGMPDIRRYVSVDGGMTDNIRPGLYEARYDALVANKTGEAETELVTIAGKCCESTDILIRDIKLPKISKGDVILVKSTGAYNYSMANRYNKTPVPAVVMIKDGKDRLSVKRETFEDLYRNEI